VQHAKSRECHLEIDPFWQVQPTQCYKGVRAVVITTQSIHQTRGASADKPEVHQDKITIIEPRVHM